MWQRFSPSARDVILRAQTRAKEENRDGVSAVQIFLALLETASPESQLGALLLGAGLKSEEARLYVEAHQKEPSGTPNGGDDEPKITPDGKRALEYAANEARRLKSTEIETAHLLLACVNPRVEPNLAATLAPLGWKVEILRAKQRELTAHVPPPNSPLETLTVNGEKAVEAAYDAMRATYCGRISTAHLLLGILQDERVVEILTELGVSPTDLQTRARAEIRNDSQLATTDKRFDDGAKRALGRARIEAFSFGHKYIGPEYLLLGLLPCTPSVEEKLRWGAQVADDAATVLSDLDGQKLRELLGSQISPTTTDIFPVTAKFSFYSMLIAGVASTYLLLHYRKMPSPFNILGMGIFLLLLLTTGSGACWTIVTSKKPHTRSAWGMAFFGFLLGMTLSLLFLRE